MPDEHLSEAALLLLNKIPDLLDEQTRLWLARRIDCDDWLDGDGEALCDLLKRPRA
jgi:hypothetical protein